MDVPAFHHSLRQLKECFTNYSRRYSHAAQPFDEYVPQILIYIQSMDIVSEMRTILDCICEGLEHPVPICRSISFRILDHVIEHHVHHMSMKLKTDFFQLLDRHIYATDFSSCLHSLSLLTVEGRKIIYGCEEKMVGLVVKWLLAESPGQAQLEAFIIQMLRRSPTAAFPLEDIREITHVFCNRCYVAWKQGNAASCRQYLRYFSVCSMNYANGYARIIVSRGLPTLCRMVNEDGTGTWAIMKNLLHSACCPHVLSGLIDLLQSPLGTIWCLTYIHECDTLTTVVLEHSRWVLRGAVFFIGMSCWGSQRIEHLESSWGVVLPSLLGIVACDQPVVVFEVILSVQRLIKKFGEVMRVEWDIVLEILAQLRPWLSDLEMKKTEAVAVINESARRRYLDTHTRADSDVDPPPIPDVDENRFAIQNTRIPQEILDSIVYMEEIYRKNEFHGDEDSLFEVLELYIDHVQDATILLLLAYRTKGTNPVHHVDWMSTLESIVETFFGPPHRGIIIREQVLNIIQSSISSYKYMRFGDQVIDMIVLPYLSNIYDDDQDEHIRRTGLELLIDVAREVESDTFDSLLDILERAVYASKFEDAQRTAAVGIVSLFSSAFDHLPVTRSVRLYQVLLKIVEQHAHAQLREISLSCLVRVTQATSQYQIQYREEKENGDVFRTSRFLSCSRWTCATIGAVLPVHQAFSAMLAFVRTETNHDLLHMAITGMRRMLENGYILKDMNFEESVLKLVSSLQVQAFGRGGLSLSLTTATEKKNSMHHHHHPSPTYPEQQQQGSGSMTEEESEIASKRSTSGNPNHAMLENTRRVNVLQLTLLEIGYRLLSLLLGSSMDQLLPFAQLQVFHCFKVALEIRPTMPGKVYEVENTPSINQMKSRESVPGLFESTKNAFVRRNEGSIEKKVLASARTTVEENLKTSSHEQLFQVECAFKQTVYQGIGICAMMMMNVSHEAKTYLLNDILHSLYRSSLIQNTTVHPSPFSYRDMIIHASSNDGLRLDLYGHSLEVLVNLLSTSTCALSRQHFQHMIEYAIPAFELQKDPRMAKKSHMVAYKVLTQCFSRCCPNGLDRLELAKVVLPLLEHRRDLTMAQVAMDFISGMTVASARAQPGPLTRLPHSPFFSPDAILKTKYWLHENTIIEITSGKLGTCAMTLRKPCGAMQWTIQCHHQGRTVDRRSSSGSLKLVLQSERSIIPDDHYPTEEEHVGNNRKSRLHRLYHRSSGSSLPSSGSSLPSSESSRIMTPRTSTPSENVQVGTLLKTPNYILPLPSYDGVGGSSPSIFVQPPPPPPQSSSETMVADIPQNRTHRRVPKDPQHKLSSANDDDDDDDVVDPAFFMAQLFGLRHARELTHSKDLDRALSVLDRTPGVDTHKIGLIYVCPNQTSEHEILGNVSRSGVYLDFLSQLGTLERLEGMVGYTGGLDVSPSGDDGVSCLAYRDECTQAIFHVATLMKECGPLEDPQSHRSRKRHIGNDCVTIVFLNPYVECVYDHALTFPGQFNDVQVLVQPLLNECASKCENNNNEPREDMSRCGDYYRVDVRAKRDIGHFGPLVRGVQIVPQAHVALAVRQTAFHADIACRVYHESRIAFVSNAEERLKQIVQIHTRQSTATT